MAHEIEHIKELVSFVSKLDAKEFIGRYLTAHKELDQELYQDLARLEEHGFVHELVYKDEPLGGTAALKRKLDRDQQGDVHFKLELPRSSKLFYTDSLDKVILHQNFAWEKPHTLILDALSYDGTDGSDPPELVKAYHLAIDLISLLTDPKAGNHSHRGNDGLELYILGPNKKLQVDIKYSSSDLNFDALEKAMSTFEGILGETAYSGTKYAILRSTLIDLLMPVQQTDRCRHLLRHITEAATQFRQNYELFLSEFKFENEREKIETAKREYILGINKVFDDIQNKILAIPASLILIGGQMNFTSNVEPKILVSNAVILFGSIIFSWIMLLMTRNQMHSLNAIKSDYNIRKRRIRFQLSDCQLYGELDNAFRAVDTRYRKQRRRLWIINLMILAGLIITGYLFSKTTAFPYLQSKVEACWIFVKNMCMVAIQAP